MKSDEERENPRTLRVRQVILDAAIELLLAGGAGAVTAARIAEETRVARTTIYRQWPDQASLLLATIEQLVKPHFPSPGVGPLDSDLITALSELRYRLDTKQVRPVFAALAEYASREDDFIAAQRRFVEGLIQPTINVLEEAKSRGELPDDLACDDAATVLVGPVLFQFLVMREAVEDHLIEDVVRQFCHAHPAD